MSELPIYINGALEFLEEERDGWAPYEVLAELSDEQLTAEVDGAHGWTGRDLMAHLLAWQGVSLDAAKELAVTRRARHRAGRCRLGCPWWRRRERRDHRTWAAMPMDDCGSGSGPSRGAPRLSDVVPETRWLKHRPSQVVHDETIAHYEEHTDDLRAIWRARSLDDAPGRHRCGRAVHPERRDEERARWGRDVVGQRHDLRGADHPMAVEHRSCSTRSWRALPPDARGDQISTRVGMGRCPARVVDGHVADGSGRGSIRPSPAEGREA